MAAKKKGPAPSAVRRRRAAQEGSARTALPGRRCKKGAPRKAGQEARPGKRCQEGRRENPR